MDLKGKKGIGFLYALRGIKHVFIHERNFRLQMIAFICVVIAAMVFKLTRIEWMIIVLVSGGVVTAEMFNSAVERMIDFVKPDMHPTAKIIKDVAAGGVLIAAIGAVIIGCILFIPKLIELF